MTVILAMPHRQYHRHSHYPHLHYVFTAEEACAVRQHIFVESTCISQGLLEMTVIWRYCIANITGIPMICLHYHRHPRDLPLGMLHRDEACLRLN